jgi:hypothetical protein
LSFSPNSKPYLYWLLNDLLKLFGKLLKILWNSLDVIPFYYLRCSENRAKAKNTPPAVKIDSTICIGLFNEKNSSDYNNSLSLGSRRVGSNALQTG